MKELHFITIGDKKFFSFICYSAKLIQRIYPDAKFYIYDIGFKNDQLNILKRYQNTIIINWRKELKDKKFLDKISASSNLYGNLKQSRWLEFLFLQKPLCILDCAKRINKNLIYLDGDALLIKEIDEILNSDFDIGVTIRIEKKILKIKDSLGISANINAGVIFFLTTSNKIQAFILEWMKLINFNNKIWLEQTALNNLIKNAHSEIFKKYYNRAILKISDFDFKVRTLPCEYYNHYKIHEGYDKKTKILHFRLSKTGFKNISLIEIVRIIKLGPIFSKLFKYLPIETRDYFRIIINLNFILQILKNPINLRNLFKTILEPYNEYVKFKRSVLRH